ncbi:hypothetical protein HYQ45_000567 [Verticillium longisporum]|uniref:Uncharacterized protein n=1 Tax=Verticillium longisporum TaxID=100787 RepID=A0A8I3AYR2_VERLO|nr:hypothetical protein HYQ45_000567 [Verticillium longisporum]
MNNASNTCSNDNPDYVQDDHGNDDHTKWSGCGIPSNSTDAPVLQACCEALGDDFVYTYQDYFPLFSETHDIASCWTTCMVNVSSVSFADSTNVTQCMINSLAKTDDNDPHGKLCGGPGMRSLAARPGLDVASWGVAAVALLACLLRG